MLYEQSTLPLKNAQRVHDNVRLFGVAIRAAGAATALYMAWARRDAPPDAHDRIAEAYESVGRDGARSWCRSGGRSSGS